MTQAAPPTAAPANAGGVAYERLLASAPTDGPAWLSAIRRHAASTFAGWPNPQDEVWRFTQLNPVLRATYRLTTPGADVSATYARHTLADSSAAEIVIVDGRYVAGLSKLAGLPAGVTVTNLASAIASNHELVRAHLAQCNKPAAGQPFAAINTAFLSDGVVIHFAAGVSLASPISILHISGGNGHATVSHPRALILVDPGANASVVQTFAGTGHYLTNAVTEIRVGADAVLDYNTLQQESLDAFHLHNIHATLDTKAVFRSHAGNIGAAVSRNDLAAILAGEFADATLNGLVLVDGQQHCDNHTLLEHAAPNCPSYELYKHVLGGKSSAVFKGKIHVRQIAQKTNSKQTSKSLLLSDDANMNSQPALEIYADDVKCTHGSTIGPVDQDMLFYIRSRGVSAEAAKHLLTYAFAADMTRRIKVAAVRDRIESVMASQHGLPNSLRITDLADVHDDVL